MKLTAELIHGFTQAVLLSRFDDPKPTPEFHKELWELACSDDDLVAIAAPRGHAKSTAITHAYTLAEVLFRSRNFVLLVSDTEGQAIQFLGDIKIEIQENEELIQLFGIKKFIKDTETDIIVEFNDGDQFRIIAKGSEQKMRGAKWRGRRPNLIIGDDLENDEIVLNEDRREKFRTWFNNALIPAGSDNCKVRVVGTILHLDSMLERIMPPLNGEYTVDLPLKSYATELTKEWRSVRFRAHDEDYSNLLWDTKFSKDRLNRIRNRYIQEGNPEGYAQEYLNYPVDPTTAFFRKADFLPLSDPGEYVEYYAAADLAISEKDKRAYSVIGVAGLSSTGKLKVVSIVRFRGDAYDIINELFATQLKYSPQLFAIEQENIAKAIGAPLEVEMRNQGVYLNIEPVIPSKDKLTRARPLQARMRAGQVEFDTDAEWYPDLLQEFLQFPKGAYKDQVDTLSWIAHILAKMAQVPDREELEDMNWQDEWDDTMEHNDDGKNWIGGY